MNPNYLKIIYFFRNFLIKFLNFFQCHKMLKSGQIYPNFYIYSLNSWVSDLNYYVNINFFKTFHKIAFFLGGGGGYKKKKIVHKILIARSLILKYILGYFQIYQQIFFTFFGSLKVTTPHKYKIFTASNQKLNIYLQIL